MADKIYVPVKIYDSCKKINYYYSLFCFSC